MSSGWTRGRRRKRRLWPSPHPWVRCPGGSCHPCPWAREPRALPKDPRTTGIQNPQGKLRPSWRAYAPPISCMPSHLDVPRTDAGPRCLTLSRAGDGDSGPFLLAPSCGTSVPARGPGNPRWGGAGAPREAAEDLSFRSEERWQVGRGGWGAPGLAWAAHTWSLSQILGALSS